MGQAKNRGTLEERQAEGVAKREARLEEYDKRQKARWAAMSEKERLEYVNMVGFLASMGIYDEI